MKNKGVHMIAIGYEYDRREYPKNKRNKPDPTRPIGQRVVAVKAGAIIERCGRKYRIAADGSQHRV